MGAKGEILQVNGVKYRNTHLFVKTCTLQILDFCGGFYYDAPWQVSLLSLYLLTPKPVQVMRVARRVAMEDM